MFESFSWKHNNYYYYCHDCKVGEEMKTDSYPYKFVIFFDNDTYFCFLASECAVKDLIMSFSKLILGDK